MVVTGIKYVLVVIGRTLTKGSYDYMGGGVVRISETGPSRRLSYNVKSRRQGKSISENQIKIYSANLARVARVLCGVKIWNTARSDALREGPSLRSKTSHSLYNTALSKDHLDY